ncbi:MAG: hypothetical protein WCG87_08385, partial [Bacteroidota bacterium]
MRYTYFFILSIGICGVISCSSLKHAPKRVSGIWQSLPITVDGDSKDWPSPYPSYDSKAMVGYAVTNDKNNVYLTIEAGDEATQTKILRAGMTIWIDGTGNKDQTMAIHYPVENNTSPVKMKKAPDGMHMSDSGMMRRMAMDNTREFSVEGFKNCNGPLVVGKENACGIQVKIGYDEYHELIWEAAIPFKAFYTKAQIDRADMGKPISICFAIKGLHKPEGEAGKGGGQGRSEGGG